jgi:ribosome-associated heat shock protein Hsp15
VKTRALGGLLAEKGRVRVNGARVEKAHRLIRVGDVLTIAHGPGVMVLRVVAPGTRRGPAAEARTLYTLIEGTEAPWAS